MAPENGIPALVGVNEMNRPEFLAFAGGLAQRIPPDLEALRSWYRSARTPEAAAPA